MASPCWCAKSWAPTRSAARCSPSDPILRQAQDEGADRLKLLFFDGTGVVLVAKRLEAGAFRWPKPGDGAIRLTAAEMAALVDGLDWQRVHVPRETVVPRLAG